MGTLSHDSLTHFVNGLSREACVSLFQMEMDNRPQINTPCKLPPKNSAVKIGTILNQQNSAPFDRELILNPAPSP